jgi:hypothetical protein
MRLGVHPGTNRIYLSCRMMDAVIVYGDQGAVEEHPIHETRKLSVEVTPNPFREKIEIQLMGISEDQNIRSSEIRIFDISGREVKNFPIPNPSINTSTSSAYPCGECKSNHSGSYDSQFPVVSVEWDGKDVAPGVYFLTIDGVEKKKIVKIE